MPGVGVAVDSVVPMPMPRVVVVVIPMRVLVGVNVWTGRALPRVAAGREKMAVDVWQQRFFSAADSQQ